MIKQHVNYTLLVDIFQISIYMADIKFKFLVALLELFVKMSFELQIIQNQDRSSNTFCYIMFKLDKENKRVFNVYHEKTID